jgi:pimeloyl-ACP methyl ester carboxylesterase
MTFIAAAADPTLFSAIVPVDPLMLCGWKAVLWGAMKRLGLGGRLPLVRGARNRRAHWPNLEVVRTVYRCKAMFAGWDPEVFDDYLEAGLVRSPDGDLELAYPKEWEARIFEVSPHDPWPLVRRLRTPTLFVRGAGSDTFTAAAAARLRRVNPEVRVHAMADTSHFVPMERPDALAGLIIDSVDEMVGTSPW